MLHRLATVATGRSRCSTVWRQWLRMDRDAPTFGALRSSTVEEDLTPLRQLTRRVGMGRSLADASGWDGTLANALTLRFNS